MALRNRILGLNKPYKVLFFEREYNALAGVKKRLIISLVLILSLTFAAICFSVGAIENLRIKMNDPFTNWMDIPLKSHGGITHNNVSGFLKEFDTDSTKAIYAIKDISKIGAVSIDFYRSRYLPVEYRPDTLILALQGQTIDFKSELFKSIVKPENVSQNFTEGGDNIIPLLSEVVIKKSLLRALGFEDNPMITPYLWIRTSDDELLPLRIAGVVDKLPKDVNFVCSESFKNVYDNRDLRSCGDKYIKSNKGGGNKFRLILPDQVKSYDLFCETIKQGLRATEEVTYSAGEELTINEQTYRKVSLQFGYSDTVSFEAMAKLSREFSSSKFPFALVSEFENKIDCEGLDKNEIDYLQFNFMKLVHIKAFANEMQSRGVNLNMREVESKENFSLVSDLTMAISIILFGFGLLSIILYVNNSLKSHLNKISSNLGTFKAFGLNNRFLVGLYRKIVFTYLLVGVTFALIFVFILDIIESNISEPNDSKFTALSPWLYLAILCLFIISDIVSTRTTKKILEKTPGDLIYNR